MAIRAGGKIKPSAEFHGPIWSQFQPISILRCSISLTLGTILGRFRAYRGRCSERQLCCQKAKDLCIASRRGPKKALVAIQHSTPTAIWHMLANGEVYQDQAQTTTPASTTKKQSHDQSSNSKTSETKWKSLSWLAA